MKQDWHDRYKKNKYMNEKKKKTNAYQKWHKNERNIRFLPKWKKYERRWKLNLAIMEKGWMKKKKNMTLPWWKKQRLRERWKVDLAKSQKGWWKLGLNQESLSLKSDPYVTGSYAPGHCQPFRMRSEICAEYKIRLIFCQIKFIPQGTYIYTYMHTPGGGGGTQIWFRRGCAAEAAKPVPIFKGHFGGKGYPLLRVFSQENDVFMYFSDEMGENI